MRLLVVSGQQDLEFEEVLKEASQKSLTLGLEGTPESKQ
jgi:hypothetical protein